MSDRLDLQALLVETLGSNHVYFQPPEDLKIQYPCIVYRRDRANSTHADNELYRFVQRYTVTVIDANPDSDLHLKVAKLPMCSYNRFYTADKLNHDVYNLFF